MNDKLYVGRKVYKGDIFGLQGEIIAVKDDWYQVAWTDGTTVWELPKNIYAPTR